MGRFYVKCCGKWKSFEQIDENDPTICKACASVYLTAASKIRTMQEEEYREGIQTLQQCVA